MRPPKRKTNFRQNISPRGKFLLKIGVLIFVLVVFFVSWHRFFLDNSKLIPTDGGILTESTIGITRNLNPLSIDSTLFDKDVQSLIFAGLLKYNPASGQIEDGLANFQVSEDAREYTLTLKDSGRFSNGKKVETNDVIFTFERIIQNPDFSNNVLHDAFKYIIMKVIDDRTIAFRLPEKNVFFPSFLTVPILPAESFQDALIEEVTDPDFPFNKKPIGAGPFQFENLVPNNDGSFRVFLKKNKHFYGGAAKIDQIVFYVFPDFEHLDISHEWTTLFSKLPFSRIKKFSEKLFGEHSMREYLLPRWMATFFNLDSESPVNNPRFRRALFYAIDKEKILEKNWNRVDSIFFFEGIDDWHEPDPVEARKLLRDNGFPYNKKLEQRTLGKNGKPISLKLITSTEPAVYSRFLQNIAKTWRDELNIETEIEILDKAEFAVALRDRDYDLVLFGQNFSQNFDPYSMWHSSEAKQSNLSNLTNDDIDFLIDEIRFSGAQSDVFLLNEKLAEILPAIILGSPKYNLFVSSSLFGFSESFGKLRTHSDRFYNVENWYFYKKRAFDLEGKSKIAEFFKWIFKTDEEKVLQEEPVAKIETETLNEEN
ncbi:MAG: ABC transporter substrate-binding protein [Candidatus Peregrinibacteria bacterium]|nr:ABC transporter substrate-binding protein [Candidatus Peregrinibacteria bacterium]